VGAAVSDWIADLGERGAPFASAARRFTRWRGGAPGAGTAGIRWLTGELDAFAHDDEAPADHDERFVEGAGALLGLLLIAHLGGRCTSKEGRHQVHLGPGLAPGTFDPFAAVDAALDANDPLTALADAIRDAEGEAAGTGTRSRCVVAFHAALRDARPERSIAARHGLEVELDDGTEIDLERVLAAEDAGDAARRLVSLLPGGPVLELDWADAAPRLLPRLVGQRFVDELGARADALQLRPLVGHIHVALQLRYEGRSRFVRRSEVDAWLDAGHDPARRALANLTDVDARLDVRPVEDDVYALTTGDALDATRLLLPRLADELEARIGRPFLAAVPHRDVLLLCPDDFAAERRLVAHARELHDRAPHPIAAHAVQVDGTRITDC